jgi:hypothetical protein
MASIRIKIGLRRFLVSSSNEGVGDEPYLWPFYFRIDGRVLDSPHDQAKLPLFAPPGRHGNISELTVVNVADWETELEPGVLTINGLWKNCMVGVGVAFLEEDGTSDGTLAEAHAAAVKEVQRQADLLLQQALGEMKFPDDFALDQNRLEKAIISRVLLPTFGEFMMGIVIPFGFGNLAGIFDPDDRIGFANEMIHLDQLIGHNHEETTFSMGASTHFEGAYSVTGFARRVDTDEVPTLAVTRVGPKALRLYARNIEDTLSWFSSTNDGQSFEAKGKAFEQSSFRSGPGACSTADGAHRHIAALTPNGQFRHLRTDDHGHDAGDAELIREMTFKGSPALACTADGKKLYAIGRGHDDRYFVTRSHDRGEHWQVWEPIRERTFGSSPAAVVTPDGKRLMAVGLGNDKKLWITSSRDEGEHWVEWSRIPDNAPVDGEERPFHHLTSAPAAAISGDGRYVHLVCRARDLTYWYTTSPDGGRSWFGYWFPLAGQKLFSAPAIVTEETGDGMCVVGLSDALEPWRCLKTTQGTSDWDPVTPDTHLMIYY